MRIRRKTIQRIVTDLLQQNHVIRPPVPVDRIAKMLGLDVELTPGHDDDLSGFLLRNAATNKAVVGVNRSHHKNRQRFTVAHEIGHFLLHEGEPVHVDGRENFRVDRRSSQSSTGDRPDEIEANAFAAELLMPANLLRKDLDSGGELVDLSDDDAMKALANKYGVSVAAMSFRLANLGYISL